MTHINFFKNGRALSVLKWVDTENGESIGIRTQQFAGDNTLAAQPRVLIKSKTGGADQQSGAAALRNPELLDRFGVLAQARPPRMGRQGSIRTQGQFIQSPCGRLPTINIRVENP